MSDQALAIREPEAVTVREMESEVLGKLVQCQIVIVHTTLIALKPYIEELWRRFDNGETILGCKTRKEFCLQVLDRTPRAVRYMLEGGNPASNRKASQPGKRSANPKSPTNASEGKHVSLPRIPKSLEDIRLEPCSSTDPRYVDIREDHYIPNHGCIGQQAHFLIHYKDEIAGIVSGASPVYATSSRDQFFGIDKRNRGEFLQGIVNNVVFRLENHEPNLASRVLCVWRNVIPHFWYERYGTVVYGFETFVIENDIRKGALYKADNWTFAGTTAGATKVRNGIENPANNWKEVTPKLIYCRWRDGFSHPCSARTPEWTRTLYRDIPLSWAAAGSDSWSHSRKGDVAA